VSVEFFDISLAHVVYMICDRGYVKREIVLFVPKRTLAYRLFLRRKNEKKCIMLNNFGEFVQYYWFFLYKIVIEYRFKAIGYYNYNICSN